MPPKKSTIIKRLSDKGQSKVYNIIITDNGECIWSNGYMFDTDRELVRVIVSHTEKIVTRITFYSKDVPAVVINVFSDRRMEIEQSKNTIKLNEHQSMLYAFMLRYSHCIRVNFQDYSTIMDTDRAFMGNVKLI